MSERVPCAKSIVDSAPTLYFLLLFPLLQQHLFPLRLNRGVQAFPRLTLFRAYFPFQPSPQWHPFLLLLLLLLLLGLGPYQI